MSKTREVTIVPHNTGIFSKEWLTVVLVAIAAAVVWTVAWNSIRSEANDKPVYQVQKKIKELEVTFIDVGQGDSCFIRTPNGHTILVDAGPSGGIYSSFDAGEQKVVPFLQRKGIKKIDTLMMTHPHADHYGGMNYLLGTDIVIGEYLDPGMDHPTTAYRKLLEKINLKKIPFHKIRAPRVLNWDSDILVQVLWPEENFRADNPNNASIFFRLVYGDIVYTFTGDVEAEIEAVLNAYGPTMRTTVLKVPHHGSNTSSTRSFLENITPRLAIFSVGHNNRFNHPNRDIVNLYEKMNVPSLRTDRSGNISTFTDGKVVHVKPELGSPFDIYPFPKTAPVTEGDNL